jgi:5'-3' exoribonuclease 1
MPSEKSFDSNCITPGTEFMFRLGIAFRRWIAYKMETDPFWQNGAEVVFSGPGIAKFHFSLFQSKMRFL